MYKIAILGCENSHAIGFLDIISKDYSDVQVIGLYSDEEGVAEALGKKYGVPVMKTADELVGKVDGVAIVARHGGKRYAMAKPYIAAGVPVLLDKPVVNSEEDALALKANLKAHNTKACGGSLCRFPRPVQDLKKAVAEKTWGEVYGGLLRAPINTDNEYGGFPYYAQHLVQVMGEIFGYYPNSVQAFVNGKAINCIVRYDSYDVNLQFVEQNDNFYAGISCENYGVFEKYGFAGCFEKEFAELYGLICGGEQHDSYDDLIAPIFVMCAIERSIQSGKEETVHRA
ncbi:MAG: Gfo/Idh/MocA family oxidoreductase [Oscillospiraceae bacterium]|nr:Gfo/Idh/MocA family oxidoreductase [Oscillospiraceae bacterium]